MNKLNTKLMILLAAFSLMGVGCNNKMTVADSSALVNTGTGSVAVPDSPDSTGSTDGSSTVNYSNEATFTPVSIAEFNNYVGSHPLNDPQNFKLKIDLAQVESTGRFAGSVSISYTDTGTYYNGTFTSGSGRNSSYSGMKDNDRLESYYNTWFTYNSKWAFSGFFQDQWGAIVVVVDSLVNQGDGQGGSIVTGSVYYRNFANSYTTQSPYRSCWFIYQGPFECRAGGVINKNSLVPGDGYRKLGTFSGISKAAAFQ